MLTDAILGLVAKGIYLGAKHGPLTTSDKKRILPAWIGCGTLEHY